MNYGILINRHMHKERSYQQPRLDSDELVKAIDEIRAAEAKRLAAEGYDEEVLKHTKYCFLKNEENLTEKRKIKLADVLQYDLKSVRAYLLTSHI